MIAILEGSVAHLDPRFAVISAGGVGYKVFPTPEALALIREKRGAPGADARPTVRLWTYLAVRENALDLYGFARREELDFFELLLGVSGIGPKSALGILSIASPETLRAAVSAGDTSYLTKVSGIGRKSAERIVIELRDKLGAIEHEGAATTLRDEAEAIEALKALGYSAAEAREALKKVPEGITGVSEKVREALKNLI